MTLKNKYEGKIVSQIKSVKMADDESSDIIISGYANTVTKDRAGDVIPKDTWLKSNATSNYSKNPIILAFHDHSKPIGKATNWYADDNGLFIEAKISKGAGDVYHLIKDGVLSTFSVGFYIHDAEYHSKTDTYMITDLELLEVSVVSVPCNQDSTFSVSKSLVDAEAFKKEFVPPAEEAENTDIKEIQDMSTKNENTGLTLDDVMGLLDKERQKEADAKAKEAAAKAAAAKQAEEIKTQAREAAKSIVDELEGKIASNQKSFADTLKAREDEIEALREQAKQRFSQQGGGANMPELPAELFTDNAKRRVSIGLLLGEIIKVNELKADEDKVNALIETSASAYEDPQEVIEYYQNNEELMQQMKNVALEEQAIEWVLEKAKTQEVTKAFDEVMKKQA